MSNVWNTESGEKTRTTVEARQAVSGMGVRYVLAVSLTATLVGLLVVYYFIF